MFCRAAAQVKKAMEVAHRLGGENYVFWGGREGYHCLLNTDLKGELDQLACFLRLAADHKKKIGATFQLLIEPKPREPTAHQYDFDAQTVIGFSATEWWPAGACLHEEPSAYQSQFQKPS